MVKILDDFESGSLSSEYHLNTAEHTVQSSVVYEGSYADELVDGQYGEIYRDDVTVSTGETPISAWVYGTSSDQSAPTFWWAAYQDADGHYAGYTITVDTYNDSFILKRAYVDDSGNTESSDFGTRESLGSSSVSINANTWYKLVVTKFDSDGNITAEVRDTSGTTLASISATDTNFTSGGIGWAEDDYIGAAIDRTAYFDYAKKPTPLSAPANVHFNDTQTEDELTLDWDETENAAGYYVYRDESSGSTTGDYTQVADVTGPPYTDTELEDGEQYYYRVSSHD